MVGDGDGCGRVECGLLRKVGSSSECGGGRGSETADRPRAVFVRGDHWWGRGRRPSQRASHVSYLIYFILIV